MRGWWREFSGLVLPTACGGCGRQRTALCERCRAALLGARVRRVRPAPEPAGLPTVFAAARYEDAVRAVLLDHKERGALGLAGVLGQALAGAVRAAAGPGGQGRLVLVPVPSSRRAVRSRGHDATRRMAFAAAAELRRTGTDARVAAVLRQRHGVADQTGLSAPERLANLSGALTVAGGGVGLLTGGQVVLVDDLMTTGASLVEAARAVRGAGVREPRTGFPARDGCLRQGIAGFSLREPAHHLRRTGEAQSDAGQPPLVAAVVAATPESFAINRN
ncbi:ComF family protein [Streptomyces sp. NBC_00442]|uniref:ComF family protein n=1 Tax=Streptomyces sp. NBC_00442 TaxID=2903651 RepID=UPI002E1FDF06